MSQYSYIGLSGEVVVLADSQINFRGVWSQTTSYAVRDAASYGNRWYIAVTAHTGVTPPSVYVTETPTYWSPLVLVEGDPEALDTASEIAAAAAIGMATLALETSWAGTEAAAVAHALAATGTDSADQAYALATLALNTAWSGTQAPAIDGVYSLARLALDTAWAGTQTAAAAQGAADQADSLAQQALIQANSGTDAAFAARFGVVNYWAGRMVQSGNNAPVATVCRNTFQGADFVWSYVSTGVYEGVLNPAIGALPPGYTGVQISPYYSSANGTMSIPAYEIIDSNTVRVTSWKTNPGNPTLTLDDDRLNVFMEIKTFEPPS
ncbi:MAG: hypothetical protein ACOYB3_01165 [Azonexus sp.]